MTRVCFFCQRVLPANTSLEQFPVGRRVAYDPEQGRLWAVCPACARWNLAPIEERWEALEQLERLARDRARLLTKTDNIGLLRAGELELVRVGRAELREEAWWRYGRELARRHGRMQRLLVLDVALALTLGMPLARDIVRGTTFANGAPTGVRRCERCGASLSAGALSVRRAEDLLLQPGEGGGIRLRLECRYCQRRHEQGGASWTGTDAERILRTVLAYQNFSGGDTRAIDTACGRIVAAGSPAGLVAEVAGWELQLAALRLTMYPNAGLALEVAVNEEHERALLAREAAALEKQWRKEETIAAIVDRELTPLPGARPPSAGS